MNDRNLVRGLILIAISLAFGLQSLRYPIGQFSHAGAGLFPLMVSCLLLLIGVIIVVRSHFVERERLHFQLRNIAIILASLCGFALISHFLNMAFGGYKQSGLGREYGAESIDAYTQTKAVLVRY